MWYLCDEDSQEGQGQALEPVVLDELVQVDAHELKNEAQVVAEQEVVPHAHDVVLVFSICPLVQVLEDTDLNASLH